VDVYAMRESDFNGRARTTPRSLVDVIERIDSELGALDEELKQIDNSVERDLRELYETHKANKPGGRALEFDAFKGRHRDRLITIKTQALIKAKNDLEELRTEILRAR
jgi:hypothetical protein